MMKQEDLVINNIPIVINTNENGVWVEDFLIVLKPDATKREVRYIINYLFEEGIILDRRIKYEIK